MAQVDERSLLPTEKPSTSVPDPALHLNVTPGAFGAASARGTEQFGQSALTAGEHWGQIAADDVATQFEDAARKIVYGDPSKVVTNPDGTKSPDLGFHGLKGSAALEQRASYERQMKDAREKAASKLASPDARKNFDQLTRRYFNILSGDMGRHADQQASVYASKVQEATIQSKRADIVLAANDDESFKHFAAELIDAHRKLAQAKGATPGDALWQAAEAKGRAEAATERIATIGATDPMRADRMADEMKGDLGIHYPQVKEHFRVRANQQQGRQVADSMLAGTPPPAGDDAKAVIRHFEGFREQPYRDNDGKLRVGYGSDTMTKADGTVVPVTAETRVTREDAERDLERRAALTQQGIRQQVGAETWLGLTNETKASLSSVAYNYGSLPKEVVEAVKTKDPAQIAEAIRGLARHNNGINSSRRASEANNIAPAAPGGDAGRSQAEIIDEIRRKNLPPEAEAAAIARVGQSYAHRQDTEVRQRTAFDGTVKDSIAEAMNTGVTRNPITRETFERFYGKTLGPQKYEAYIDDVQFGADFKAIQTMPDAEQTQLVNARGPQPEQTVGYERSVRNQQRLQKTVDLVQKQRAEDPAGSVSRMPAVTEAFKSYDPKKPETFAPVMAARLAAQEQLGIPEAVQSAITDGEAKKYAAALKPIAKDGVPAGRQEQVINSVVENVTAKYGERAPEAMSRVLYHVTMKKDASDILAEALIRNSKGQDPAPTPEQLRKIQIERDAERAAQLAGQRTAQQQEAQQVQPMAVGGPEGVPSPPIQPETVKDTVNQANQKTQKSFGDAVTMLRSDPGKYMPYFVQKFGVNKVPPDLTQYLPKPEPLSGR